MAPREPKGCLFGWLFDLLDLFDGDGSGGGRGAALPRVMVNNRFVTRAEGAFFQVLRRTVGDRGHVLAQVSLGRLLFFPGSNRGSPGRATWQNKVARKSVDFVICDRGTLRPMLVVELDDASHDRPDRQVRDEEVRAILRAAGLPIIGVPWSDTYNTRELEAAIGPHLRPPD